MSLVAASGDSGLPMHAFGLRLALLISVRQTRGRIHHPTNAGRVCGEEHVHEAVHVHRVCGPGILDRARHRRERGLMQNDVHSHGSLVADASVSYVPFHKAKARGSLRPDAIEYFR